MSEDDKKNTLAIMGIPTAIVLLIIMLLPFGILNAWAVQKMYGWFLLPLGAPAINLWHTWGIAMLINHFMPTVNSDKKILVRLFTGVFGVFLMLLIGYILKGHI